MLILKYVVSYMHMIEDATPPLVHSENKNKEFDPSAGNPFIGRAQTAEAGSVESAAAVARRNFDQDTTAEPTSHRLRNAVIGTAAIGGVLALGVAGLASEQGGSNNGETRGTADNTIESVTLNPDANIRFDPYVGEGEDNNEVLHLGAQITIDINHDARVLDGTNNGTWIGIPLDEIKTVVPDISTSDKDGIVWVNEQGVKEIQRTQLETK